MESKLPVDNIPSFSSTARWTLADFLSSYRYWGLFLSSLFFAIGGQGFSAILPLISRMTGSSAQTTGIFYLGSSLGWIIGAFLAFVVASRHGRPALIFPLIACAVVVIILLLVPDLWGSAPYLFLLGLTQGAVRAVFPLAIAIFLIGGRPCKIDFGCALALISTPVLASAFAPVGASWLYQIDETELPIVLGFLACLLLAVVLLLPVRNLAFDEAPRTRNKPFEPQRRSPLMVALVLMTPLLIFLLATGVYLLQANGFDVTRAPVTVLRALLGLAIAVTGVYLAYWLYRIHGELAGAAPSQQLLTPLAGMLIAVLVPLGLPILVLTLGDLINNRVRENGQGQLISIAWLAIWSFFIPPIAVAMIQDAANKSYSFGA